MAASVPLASSTSATRSAICSNSRSLKPRVVPAGEPMRMPLVTMGGRGSLGTAFLLTVMCALPSAASASLPLIALSERSSRNR